MTKTRKRKIYGGLECLPDYNDYDTFDMRSFLYRLTSQETKSKNKDKKCDDEKNCNVYVQMAQNLIQFLVNYIDINFDLRARDIDYTNLWNAWNRHIDTNLKGMSLKDRVILLEKTLTALLRVYSDNGQGDCTSFKTFKVEKCLEFSHQLVLSFKIIASDKPVPSEKIAFDQAFDVALSKVNPPRIYTIFNLKAIQGKKPADVATLIESRLGKKGYINAKVECDSDYKVYIRSVKVIPVKIDFQSNGQIFNLINPVEQRKVSEDERYLLDLKNLENNLAKQKELALEPLASEPNPAIPPPLASEPEPEPEPEPAPPPRNLTQAPLAPPRPAPPPPSDFLKEIQKRSSQLSKVESVPEGAVHYKPTGFLVDALERNRNKYLGNTGKDTNKSNGEDSDDSDYDDSDSDDSDFRGGTTRKRRRPLLKRNKSQTTSRANWKRVHKRTQSKRCVKKSRSR